MTALRATASSAPATQGARSVWRSVALPSEHGGWGLTAEPALLGLLVAPSPAGGLLAAAAILAFLARTPLKLLLVDVWRHRRHERTDAAAKVLAAEAVALLLLVAGVSVLADPGWWWPALAAAPLVALELWFDMRSRSRRLLPELAGAAGIGSVAAMIVLADAGAADLAVGVWFLMAGRAATSIPHVRSLIARLHRRTTSPWSTVAGDGAALLAALGAVLLDPTLAAGAVAVAALVIVQRLAARRPLPPAKVLGLRQMAMGFTVVGVTAAGVHLL